MPAQAEELVAAFAAEGVDYLFIGRSGAILLAYPETTQDRSDYNRHRLP